MIVRNCSSGFPQTRFQCPPAWHLTSAIELLLLLYTIYTHTFCIFLRIYHPISLLQTSTHRTCFCCGLTSPCTILLLWAGGLVRSFSLAAAPAELVRTDTGSAFGSAAGAWGKKDVSTGEPGETRRQDEGSRVKLQKTS